MGACIEHIQKFGGISNISYNHETKVHTIGSISISDADGYIRITGDDDFSRYEKLSARLQALDSQQINNAGNFFLLQAISRGVKITPIELEDELKPREKDLIKVRHKLNKEIIKADSYNKIINAKVIDQKDYKRKTFTGNAISQSDYFEVVKFDIAKDLNKNAKDLDISDIEFYYNNGCAYTSNYQSLLQGVDKAKSNDIRDKDNGVAKTNAKWRESNVALLDLLFSKLGIDKTTGKGCYTQKESTKVRALIQENEALVRYITFKLGLNVDNSLSDTAFVNKIIKKLLGVGVRRCLIRDDGIRYWVYAINVFEMAQLTAYHKMRFGFGRSVDEVARAVGSDVGGVAGSVGCDTKAGDNDFSVGSSTDI